jgi:hypothetical protein
MNEGLEKILQESYDLIEAGKLEDARSLLKPALESEKDSADLWWLYAHSVVDVDTARLALNNVIRIDKDYPEARNLLRKLEDQSGTSVSVDFATEPAFVPPVTSSEPLNPIDVKLADDQSWHETDAGRPFYARPGCYLPAFGALLLATLFVVIFRPFATNAPDLTNSIPATPDGEAAALVLTLPSDSTTPGVTIDNVDTNDLNSTLTAQVGLTPTPDEIPLDGISDATLEATLITTSDSNLTIVEEIQSALGTRYELLDNSVSIAEDGKLSVTICTSPGVMLRSILDDAMDSLSQLVATTSNEQIASVQVNLYECSANNLLRTISTSAENLLSFSRGEISDRDFEAGWVSS